MCLRYSAEERWCTNNKVEWVVSLCEPEDCGYYAVGH